MSTTFSECTASTALIGTVKSPAFSTNGVFFNFSFGGMPYEDAERSIKCFAKYVLPELKKWNTEPLIDPAPIPSSAAAR